MERRGHCSTVSGLAGRVQRLAPGRGSLSFPWAQPTSVPGGVCEAGVGPPRLAEQHPSTLVWLLMCGRSEEGMGLRGGQDDDPSLDKGRRQVLTVLVLSHSFSTAGTKIQATEEPGGCDPEKGEGRALQLGKRGAGSREGQEAGGGQH